MKWYVELLRDSLGEVAIFVAVCAGVAVGGALLLQVPFFDGLGFVLLVVSAGLMLIGGALSFIGPANVKLVNALTRTKLNLGADDYRKARHRAALYSVTGIELFAISLAMAALFQ